MKGIKLKVYNILIFVLIKSISHEANSVTCRLAKHKNIKINITKSIEMKINMNKKLHSYLYN